MSKLPQFVQIYYRIPFHLPGIQFVWASVFYNKT
jgi:hypothetical protein